jgi:hypothetical protein
MEFFALTHPRCFLFFLPIDYLSQILHLSLIIARTRPPPHPTCTRTAAGIRPSHTCHCLSILSDRGHFIIIAFVAAPLLSSTILVSPPSLSWACCSTLCGLILPASKFLCRFPTDNSAHPPLSVLVADCCVFYDFFQSLNRRRNGTVFFAPPLLCFSHTHQLWYWLMMRGACHHWSQHRHCWGGRGGLPGWLLLFFCCTLNNVILSKWSKRSPIIGQEGVPLWLAKMEGRLIRL